MTSVHAGETQLFDAELVTYRLEEAGATLLALPGTGWSTRLRASSLEIVRAAVESYGWSEKHIRPPIPSAARITRMDEALAWIPLIPIDRYVLRRIVGARSLVHPITERHLYPWRRVATAIGADHKAVKRWHTQGIDLIVARLNAGQQLAGARLSRSEPQPADFAVLQRSAHCPVRSVNHCNAATPWRASRRRSPRWRSRVAARYGCLWIGSTQ